MERSRRIASRTVIRRGLALATAVVMTNGCWSADWDDGEGGGGGCGGTPGTLGVATFRFEQNGLDDLSDPSGNAFAVGTVELFQVELSGDPPPPVRVESVAPELFEVDAVGTAEFPHRLTFVGPGVGTLRVANADDGALVDEVVLRVAEPRALRLSAGHVAQPSFDGAGLFGEPSRVVLAPGAACRLFWHLTDGSERILYGVFSPATTTSTVVGFEAQGMTVLSLIGARVHAAQQVVGLAEGTETVRFEGPRGLAREVTFEVTATATLAAAELGLWPGYATEFELGEQTLLLAAGRTAEGHPAYGFPFEFSSSDPAVAVVTREFEQPDTAVVRFLALGTATLTVRYADDPTIAGTFEVTVVPPEPEEG